MLAERFTDRGYLPPRLRAAFDAVTRAAYLPPPYRRLAHLDVPLPSLTAPSSGTTASAVAPSPRTTILHLLTLDVPEGGRVLVDAPDGGYLAALAAELAGPEGTVTLTTGDARLAAAAGKRLRHAGYGPERVHVTATPRFREDAFDRVLLARPDGVLPTSARASLAEWGVLVARVPREGRLEYVRIVRSGHEYAELGLGDVEPLDQPLGTHVDEPWSMSRLLTLEDALGRAWTGNVGTEEEAEFVRAVDETWRPLDVHEDAWDWALARVLFHLAYVHLMSGDLDAAEDAFSASHDVLPTAEALTFLGWSWSFSGRFEDAIRACRDALELDPEFGNAYNDIGAYLVELGRSEDAVPWLMRAVHAPRYEARAYPYANLARVHLLRGDTGGACRMLRAALDEDPDYEPARLLLEHLEEGDDEAGASSGSHA